MYGLFSITAVQEFAGKQVGNYLERTYGGKAKVERLYLTFPNQLTIEQLSLANDSLVFLQANYVNADILTIRVKEKKLFVNGLYADSLQTNLYTLKGDSLNNLQHYFKIIPSQEDSTKKEIPFFINVDELEVSHSAIVLNNNNYEPLEKPLFDVKHLDMQASQLNCTDIRLGEAWSINVNELVFREKSGLNANHLAVKFYSDDESTQLEKLLLETGQSNISISGEIKHLDDEFANWPLTLSVKKAQLSTHELVHFLPNWIYNDDFVISGKIKGSIANLKGENMAIQFGNRSHITGNVSLSGLPFWETTFIEFNTSRSIFHVDDVNRLSFLNKVKPETKETFSTLDRIVFSGSLTGFPTEFVAYGGFETKIGNLETDISLAIDDTSGYSGAVTIDQFDLGKMFKTEALGKISASLSAEGSGFALAEVNVNVDGEIESLDLPNHQLKEVTLSGAFEKETFIGEVISRDEKLNFEFNGQWQFVSNEPAYNFKAQVFHIDPRVWQLKDSTLEHVAFKIDAEGKGIKPESFEGILNIREAELCKSDDLLEFGDVLLETNFDTVRHINLYSDIASIQVDGRFQTETLWDDLVATSQQHVPVLSIADDQRRGRQNFEFFAVIHNSEAINSLDPERFEIANGTVIEGFFNAKNDAFEILVKAERFRYSPLTITDFTCNIVQNGQILKDEVYASQLEYNDMSFKDFLQSANLSKGDGSVRLSWHNDLINYGAINSLVTLSDSSFQSSFYESSFWTSGLFFQIFDDNRIVYNRNGGWQIDSLLLMNNEQRFYVNGASNENGDIDAEVEVANFSINTIDQFTPKPLGIEGIVNGNVQIKSTLTNPEIIGDVTVDSLFIREKNFGEVSLSMKKINKANDILVDGVWKPEKGEVGIKGKYRLKNEDSPLDLQVSVQDLNLSLLDGLFTEEVNGFNGTANGEFEYRGKINEPLFSGVLSLNDAFVHVKYLNTGFYINDEIVIEPDFLGFNRVAIKDVNGSKGWLTGTAFHENFLDWNFDLWLEADNMLILNTNKYQNSTFYGIGYGTGTANISGYKQNLEFEMNLKANRGSKLHIPLDGSVEVESQKFVEWVTPVEYQTEESSEDETDLVGIKMNFNLEVDENTEVQVIFDEKIGDILKTRGEGKINLVIDKFGDFAMKGRYEIVRGDYLFTLQNVVNKKFNIRGGSSITWFGDPYTGIIDISADYTVRAPLYDLLLIQDERFKRREQVKCVMSLSDELMAPEIDFDIEIPNVDNLIETQVQSVVNNEQELNRQIFSLLIFNRFAQPLNRTGQQQYSGAESAAGNTLTEFASNQLSNWTSQFSKDVNIGVNYRPGDLITSRELALALSTQLFNERVTLAGNVGVTEKNTLNPSGVVGDVSVEYSLTKDGRLRLKAFNESADNYYLSSNLSPYIQGVGLYYRQDFNTLNDLWKRYTKFFHRKKKVKETEDE